VSAHGSNTPPYTNWTMAAHAIQDAIACTADGDRVIVTDGVHTVSSPVIITNLITVESVNGAGATTLDAGGVCRVMEISGAGARVRGLTITGGNAGLEAAGGIWLHGTGAVDHCVITGNEAAGIGGIFCDQGGSVTDCAISTNIANGYSSWSGGGVAVTGPGLVIGCDIFGNSSVSAGGGVYVDQGGRVEGCHIHQNETATYYSGGGAWVGWMAEMRNCLLDRNSAYNGGGIFASSGSTIESCTVADNSARQYPTSGYGGGIYLSYGAEGLRNTIVWGNVAGAVGQDLYAEDPSADSISHVCSSEGLGSDAVTADPRFDDPAGGDYRLLGYSPCVNAGANLAWMDEAADLDGNPRIIDGVADIGAYEYIPGEMVCGFDAAPVAGTNPLTVQFTALVQGTNLVGLSYHWDVDGDSLWDIEGSSHASALHTYHAPGTYTVTLVVRNAIGESCQHAKPDLVVVIPAVIRVSPDGNQTYPYDTWETAATNLNIAVDAAGDGTLVLVTNGTYLTGAQLEVDAGMRLQSVNGAGAPRIRPVSPYQHRGVNVAHAEAVVHGFTISDAGSASGTQYGGGVTLSANGLIRNCVISNCMSWAGGGIYINGAGIADNCLIVDCEGAYGAGAQVYQPGSIMSNCVVRNNTAYWNNPLLGDGGGIDLNSGRVVNCLVYDNRALNTGAGIRLRGINATVWNSTIVDNKPLGSGIQPGGVYCAASSTYLHNCIIVSNAADSVVFATGVGFNSSFDFCCSDETLSGTGNIVAAPLFVNSPFGPYRIGTGSPCVDAGTTDGAPNRDRDGIPRPLDGDGDSVPACDIGAFEYAPSGQDSDGDGLSDYDEVYLYGINPSLADSDADGMDDNLEMIAGTDPADPSDVFRVEAMDTAVYGECVILWKSVLGRRYTLRSTADLAQPEWPDVPDFIDVPGTGGIMSYTADRHDSTRFYIVVVH